MKKTFYLLALMITFNACQKDEASLEQEAIFVKDLNELMDSNKENETSRGYPWNGCKDYDVKFTTLFGIEVEFTVTHCCVQGVCATTEVWNLADGLFRSNDFPDEFNIVNSESFIFEGYSVKIKEGIYQVDDEGNIVDIVYEAVKLE
ncbi:hypothetical protein [Gaetbulibacter jejuensis]|uniref:Lipoprotein n=1 Tax=Gaetbulibacter jejuensis TaxID=584607 RepID=A0ABP3VBR2_9FLAO